MPPPGEIAQDANPEIPVLIRLFPSDIALPVGVTAPESANRGNFAEPLTFRRVSGTSTPPAFPSSDLARAGDPESSAVRDVTQHWIPIGSGPNAALLIVSVTTTAIHVGDDVAAVGDLVADSISWSGTTR
jgi:hypothetical protein